MITKKTPIEDALRGFVDLHVKYWETLRRLQRCCPDIIKDAMEAEGLTRDALAERVRFSGAYLRRIVEGSELPPPGLLTRLAAVLEPHY
jgi:ribosome-binding protein aMBF1 (putative translation factor)